MTIWTECPSAAQLQTLNVRAWRVVETQNKSYTRKLVDTDDEFDILENLLENSKPRVDEDTYAQYHYLLFTPFRYPPLKHGSRFGRRFEPSIWYGSINMETAFREVAFYRFLFLQDTHAEIALNLMLSAYSVKAYSSKAIDLTVQPFDQYREMISSALTYECSQQLGSDMRNNGVEMFAYYSARTQKSTTNIGIFYPHVFKTKRLYDEPLTWSGYVDKQSAEFWYHNRAGKLQKINCKAHEFECTGAIRYPES